MRHCGHTPDVENEAGVVSQGDEGFKMCGLLVVVETTEKERSATTRARATTRAVSVGGLPVVPGVEASTQSVNSTTGERESESTVGRTRGPTNAAPSRAPLPNASAAPTRGTANAVPTRRATEDGNAEEPTRGTVNPLPVRTSRDDARVTTTARSVVGGDDEEGEEDEESRTTGFATVGVPGASANTTTARATAYWELVEGAEFCEIVDGGRCVTDGEGRYGNNELCIVKALRALVLTTPEYAVEKGFDFIRVGETSFRGESGPRGMKVDPGTELVWSSDASQGDEGFKVCGSLVVVETTEKERSATTRVRATTRAVSVGGLPVVPGVEASTQSVNSTTGERESESTVGRTRGPTNAAPSRAPLKPKICSISSLLPKRPKITYFLYLKKGLPSSRGIDLKFSEFWSKGDQNYRR